MTSKSSLGPSYIAPLTSSSCLSASRSRLTWPTPYVSSPHVIVTNLMMKTILVQHLFLLLPWLLSQMPSLLHCTWHLTTLNVRYLQSLNFLLTLSWMMQLPSRHIPVRPIGESSHLSRPSSSQPTEIITPLAFFYTFHRL